MKTYKFFSSGRVQGVWYRKSVCDSAKKAGFKGYIKNLPDSRVESVVNIQDDDKFKEFMEILKKGSPYSEVRDIEWQEIPKSDFNDFEIRY